jgi:(p)ppGpp synthase/HD superfamily hydrolase
MSPQLNEALAHTQLLAAYFFATAAHGAIGQMRETKDDPYVPYIVHPVEVADILITNVNVTIDDLTVALLHDVLEDTEVTLSTLKRMFGDTVASRVLNLTDMYTKEMYPDLNRAERKAREAERLGKIPPEDRTIKLADGLSNTPSIALNKPKFMPVYGVEKRNLLPYLRGGDSKLWSALDNQLSALGY